jgi:hypothetical protein
MAALAVNEGGMRVRWRARVGEPRREASSGAAGGRRFLTDAFRYGNHMKFLSALVLAGIVAFGPVARAQAPTPPAELAAAADPDASAAALTRAMRLLMESGGPSELAVPASDTRRFHVTLTDDGWALGRGTGRVWSAALESAKSEARGAIPRGADALQQAAQERRLRDALLSVEVGEEGVPIAVPTFSQADWEVRAGLEGLVVTPPAGAKISDGSGAMRQVVVFPSEMMARGVAGQSPAQALVAAISAASGDSTIAMAGVPGKELGDLIKAGWTFERFSVTHAVELVKGGPALTLTRGAALVPASAITLESLKAWRQRLAAHLATRVVVQVQDGTRTYAVDAGLNPVRGEAEAPSNRTQTQMVAYALAKSHPQVAEGLLSTIAAGYQSEPASTYAEHATYARAIFALPVDAIEAIARISPVALEDALRSFQHAVNKEGVWSDDVPVSQRALVAWGIAGVQVHATIPVTEGQSNASIQPAVESLLTSAPPAALVTHMPWLAWAADDVARFEGKPIGVAVLREMRSQVWQAQIGPAVAKAEGADLEGAFLFGSGVEARRSIGWQTARPLAGIARMLASESFTSKDERMGEVVRLVASLRFLRQLTMDEASVWNCEQPEKVLWGVRNGPWDRRMSIEASVMTLLAIDEAIAALEAIR